MSIMPSHRQGLYLLEHCRVMVKDDQLTYVQQKDGFQKFFAIPFGNTNVFCWEPEHRLPNRLPVCYPMRA